MKESGSPLVQRGDPDSFFAVFTPFFIQLLLGLFSFLFHSCFLLLFFRTQIFVRTITVATINNIPNISPGAFLVPIIPVLTASVLILIFTFAINNVRLHTTQPALKISRSGSARMISVFFIFQSLFSIKKPFFCFTFLLLYQKKAALTSAVFHIKTGSARAVIPAVQVFGYSGIRVSAPSYFHLFVLPPIPAYIFSVPADG